MTGSTDHDPGSTSAGSVSARSVWARSVSTLRRFGAFWYDFVVGDDWRTAAGIVVALAVTALLSRAGVAAWWVLPVAVLGLLALSLRRATRTGGPS